MGPTADLLASIHLALLMAFVGTTSLLMLLTVVNRLRVRDVLISWSRGRVAGWPLLPVLFLAALTFLSVAGLISEQLPHPAFTAGYLTGGGFWLVADLLKSTVLVTPHGLILNVNRSDEVVAWGQIVDYFEYERGASGGLVFLYLDGGPQRRRLELQIPPARRLQFNRIAAERMAGRFRLASHEFAGRQALEE